MSRARDGYEIEPLWQRVLLIVVCVGLVVASCALMWAVLYRPFTRLRVEAPSDFEAGLASAANGLVGWGDG